MFSSIFVRLSYSQIYGGWNATLCAKYYSTFGIEDDISQSDPNCLCLMRGDLKLIRKDFCFHSQWWFILVSNIQWFVWKVKWFLFVWNDFKRGNLIWAIWQLLMFFVASNGFDGQATLCLICLSISLSESLVSAGIFGVWLLVCTL